jgi:hypothetical protein
LAPWRRHRGVAGKPGGLLEGIEGGEGRTDGVGGAGEMAERRGRRGRWPVGEVDESRRMEERGPCSEAV